MLPRMRYVYDVMLLCCCGPLVASLVGGRNDMQELKDDSWTHTFWIPLSLNLSLSF
jgi:hypothetical protein